MLLQIAVLLLLTGVASAADRPIPADRLLIRDVAHASGPKLRFAASAVPALSPGALDDPRVTGATLEIAGTGSGDGATGIIPLPPSLWTALGSPTAPSGYEFVDPARSSGMKRVVVRMGSPGNLLIVGGTSALPYAIDQAQSAIDVRLTVGDDVYCARLASPSSGAHRVVDSDAPAPAQCAPRAVRCGNRVVEAGEGCDDGNAASGDGCSPACELTDPAAVCAGVPSAFGDAIATQLVTDQLDSPTFVTAPALDPRRLFVTEQEGRIRVIRDGVLLATPFLAIEDEVLCCVERGLLSVAFHPDYAQNRRFFVYYNDNRARLVIARYEASAADPDRADPASKRVLLRIPHPGFANHNGGQLAFGPDGYLYAGPGDGGGGGDPGENAQDPESLLGKLLRIDVDVESSPYRAVPVDNPDPGAGAKLGLIWASGLRNPWRFGFDRANGDLYVADVGQNATEEIDFQPASSAGGENYGWDFFEGSSCFEPEPPAQSCPDPSAFVFPVLEYGRGDGCSITGGYVYRGCALPDLRGTYFYSDFCSSFVRTFRGVTGGVAQNREDRSADLEPAGSRTLDNVVSFGEDARGELYVVDRDGELYRIVPALP